MFNGLLSRLTERADWSRLAAETGYYDQAHLIRDFREFSGTTPAEFLRAGTEVTFFQAWR